jgi:transcription initiation factor IIF auxiliary subunit
MAVKKSKPATAATKAPAKKSATKPKKASATKAKAKAPAVASDTASKAETPKATAAPKKAAKAAPKKAAAPVKLTENQLKFLKQIQEAKEGYLTAKKAEHKTLETLLDKKLIKKGAKDKASGNFRYTVSKAGEKHLSTIPPV